MVSCRLLLTLSVLAWMTIGAAPSMAADFKAPKHHADVEHIARNIAYLGGNTKGGVGMRADPELRDAAAKRGLTIQEAIDDTTGGMQALVLQNKKSGQTYIAFRGTWPTSADGANDVIADLDLSGDTGSSQYNAHKGKLAQWARKYPGATVTGHSLGAALAQRFVSEHPRAVSEAVLFNAPAIGKEHGHRFARERKQPPVTIYVGRSKPTDGTKAPAYDIVSEFGGQSHLPGRIVEVTHLDPTDGSGATLANSHTAFMLSGRGRRQIEEVDYQAFQHRREDNWRAAEPLLRHARRAVENVDALQGMAQSIPGVGAAVNWAASQAQIGELARATANIAQGFGRASAGPTAPTDAMRGSAARDCGVADAKANDALKRSKGQITGTKLSSMKSYLRQARQHAVGCPDALGKIARAAKILDVASRRLLEKARGSIGGCDAKTVKGMANSIASFLDQPEFATVHTQLKRRVKVLSDANAKVKSALRRYGVAEKAGNTRQMDAQASAIMEAAGASDVKACMGDTFMFGRNLRTTVVGHEVAARAANRAIDGCDLTALGTTIRELKGASDAFSKALRAKARAAFKKCKKNETPEQRMARWTQRCVTKKGPGATVGFVSSNGKKFWCKPSKAAADKACATKKGAGWAAGPISKKGRYKCVQVQQRQPQIVLAGRWIVVGTAHPGESLKRPKGWWLDVQADASGAAGTLQSYWKNGENVVRGRWRHIGNSVMEVQWDDGERLRYKITNITSNSASLVKLKNGMRVEYRR